MYILDLERYCGSTLRVRSIASDLAHCSRLCVVCQLAFAAAAVVVVVVVVVFFFQAEDGIRDLVRSRGLGDVYKRQFTNFLNT